MVASGLLFCQFSEFLPATLYDIKTVSFDDFFHIKLF